MLNMKRVDYILKELQEKKEVYVKQLAKKYYVSPSSIRRDLNLLEQNGLVKRTYGGAAFIETQSEEIPFILRKNERQQEKDAICRIAAGLVENGMSVFLDVTSTAANMVRFLEGVQNLKVMTVSAQIALDCLDTLSAQVFCTGGWMNPYSRGCYGETARKEIEKYYTDLAFISVRGISMSRGIADVKEEEISLKLAMIENSKRAVLLCDSSKFGVESYQRVCGFDKIDTIITERRPPQEWQEFFTKNGVKLLYPNPGHYYDAYETKYRVTSIKEINRFL